MKVRIKIIEKNNGIKMYIPQAKDKFSFLGMMLSFLIILIFGTRWRKYYGLTKIEESNGLFGIKSGDIIQCSEEESTRFLDYDSAMAFLQEYINQEKLAIYNSKEEADMAKFLNEAEEERVKGEKIKKVKYINVKSM